MAPALGKSWLEMPAVMGGSEAVMESTSTSNLFTHTFYYGSETDSNRNYTVCYDKSARTTYWVAYPLNSSHFGSVSRTDDYEYVPSDILAQDCQVNVIGSFYAWYISSNDKGTNNYSKGHLLPSASRTNNTTANQQLFYSVNLVPQIQSNFNSGVWSTLEGALQTRANSENLYIVTGTMCSQVNDGNGSFTPEETYDTNGVNIPAPRYFYKVVLKIGGSESNPTSATAIGFWYTNQSHAGETYNDTEKFVKSVDQIEEWTGLDFFVNLPNDLEATAEAMTTPWW